ncbi:MAG: thioredoxin domain-containing protein [Phaeodactylibacter sp.]|uniref:thioredoxin family protein n=1 Tax=Phaeodactylibacter sp. TaxID=1940289 RepID=UPI0032F01E50
MKKLSIALAFIAAFAIAGFAQEGIQFEEGNWKKILAKAADQDRLIFVDAYATWCGPCKMMARDVFTQAKVGEYYNGNFVNAKIDMEKGEGVGLARKYNVRAYPTLLFVNASGELVHRAVGYQDAEAFVQLGREAQDPSRQLVTMERKFEAGERDPAFLKNYAMAAAGAMAANANEVASAYLSAQKDWTGETEMQLVFQAATQLDDPYFQEITKRREAYETLFSKQYVSSKLQRAILQSLSAEEGEGQMMEKAEAQFRKAFPDNPGPVFANFKMNYYRINDPIAYPQAAVDYLRDYPSEDANELNSIAWSFYEGVDDQKMLNEALKWAKRSVEIEPSFYNNDTLAALHYKLGQKKEAKAAAKKAIELAKAGGEDYTETQELLKKIEQL